MPTALVLGAGGTVGMAYHAGVLRALRVVGGYEAADAELIVGTSAGAVVGAYLRRGYTSTDIWELALGTHPSLAGLTEQEHEARRQAMFTPAWGSPLSLVTRGLGSAYAASRSFFPLPHIRPPAAVARRFPAGLFSMASAEQQLRDELGDEWPSRPLLLCAFDLGRRRRVVLDRDTDGIPLHRAVLASCAIPAVYRPVRAGDMTLVDGGVSSTTSLDLVVDTVGDTGRRVDRAIVVAPMGYDPAAAPSRLVQLTRTLATRALESEVRAAEAAGIALDLFRPCAAEITAHGRNLMRSDGADDIARAAYECAARDLDQQLRAAS